MGNVYELTFGQLDEEPLTCQRLELKDNLAAVVGMALNVLWRAAVDIEDAAGAPADAVAQAARDIIWLDTLAKAFNDEIADWRRAIRDAAREGRPTAINAKLSVH
jgi:hypothetical protein